MSELVPDRPDVYVMDDFCNVVSPEVARRIREFAEALNPADVVDVPESMTIRIKVRTDQ